VSDLSSTEQPAVDLEQVRREIEAEVRARRAAGVYPPGFERELDALFDRFAPPEASESFDVALTRAEEKVALEPVIPTASRNPALLVVKKVMSKLIGWYHIWLVQQVTALGATITHALRLLGRRVIEIERATGEVARARAELAAVVPERDDESWSASVLAAMRGTSGRVVVAECGAGDLLFALTAGGVDAYGVEPRAVVADEAVARGLEVRVDDAVGHLGAMAKHALAGVVLRATERLSAGERLALLDAVAERIRPGGRLAVCSVAPEAWGDPDTAVEADLAPDPPFRPATWEALLARRRFADVTVERAGAGGYVVVATRE
jgi:hypothetical protein